METTEFDAIGQHVKKSMRGACEQKAATVLPNRTVLPNVFVLACLSLSSI